MKLEDWRALHGYWRALGKNTAFLDIPPDIAAQLEQMQNMTTLLEFQDVVESSYGGADKTPPDVVDALKRMFICLQTEPEVRYTQGEWYEVLQSYRVVATVQAAEPLPRPPATELPTNSANAAEPKWKRKAYFDGTTCGYVGCEREADGYISGVKPTKGGRKNALWFGPACTKCIRKWHDGLNPYTLAELAGQRTGASDLALVLDVEVGDVLKRLAAAGIDEKGQPAAQPSNTGNNTLRDALNMSEFNEPLACARCSFSAIENYDRCPQCGETWPGARQRHPDTGAAQQQGQPVQDLQINPNLTAAADEIAQRMVGGNEYIEAEPVLLPVLYLQQHLTYAQGILQQLAPWHINNQADLDTATTFLAQIKGLWKEIEEKRVEIVRPLQTKVKEIQARFNPPKKLLEDIETILKQKIGEGVARAEQARQLAYATAQAALQSGDQHGSALAAQQAVAADITLAPTVRIQTGIGWEWDASQQLPAEFWSWVPDKAKVQAAIDAGHRVIPGVRVFETSTVVSASTRA